ncbi:MAG TPA: 50S ribosomal protein L30e [Candidatus Methanofastidiosa archaeon]|nr:50S ribosomal protein L30e [Candidatus Methanofastidiosa archaeon]
MDIAREIRKAMETGEVILGTNKSMKALKNGDAKLVIYASNCEIESRDDLDYYSKLGNVPTLEYKGTCVDLGMVCGKPFVVSMIAVLSAGDSTILSAEGD